jgi:SAM-dependent methyltransferase
MRTTAKRIIRPILVTLCGYRVGRASIEFVHQYVSRKGQWNRHHPYDEANGITTRGYLPGWLLQTGSTADAHNSGYAGCQPSCLRRGLSSIPDPERFSYLDVGCGKGRSLAVASELAFRRIVGVEIAPKVSAVAKANAAVLRKRYPGRTPIEVIAGDATLAALPDGDLVVFLYHSFGKPLLKLFVSRLVAAGAGREMFFVYENPVNGPLLDATPGFTRWHAETVACEPAEVGFAPVDSETIVVWHWGAPRSSPRHPGAEARIAGTDWRAELETDATVQ